jgi:hypothetical protein
LPPIDILAVRNLLALSKKYNSSPNPVLKTVIPLTWDLEKFSELHPFPVIISTPFATI